MHMADTPDTPQHASINVGNTTFRRVALLAAIKTISCFRKRRGSVLFLTDALCVKYGCLVQLAEAATLQFIAENTTIPVPKVYCAFAHEGCKYILMERMKGDMLMYGWSSRSEESKQKIFSQLKKIVDEMRKLKPPGPGISNATGGPLYDSRFAGTSHTVGPFDTIYDFHLFLRNGLMNPPERYPEIGAMMHLQDQSWPMPVFTHADLSTFNILVRGDEVAGIIDWETAGWYPTYWEYAMARLQPNPQNEWWKEESDHFLSPMPECLEMESLRLKYYGPFPSF